MSAKVGIVSVGVHVPRYRLTGTLLGQVWGASPAGQRAVANYDEDALTMASEAVLAALGDRDTAPIGACFLASTSAVFTFTRDHLVPNPDPPTVMVAADLDGGGRFYAQLTDADPDAVRIGAPVELTFRRIHEGEGYVNYFWKFRPALSG